MTPFFFFKLKSSLKDPFLFYSPHQMTPYFSLVLTERPPFFLYLVCHRKTPTLGVVHITVTSICESPGHWARSLVNLPKRCIINIQYTGNYITLTESGIDELTKIISRRGPMIDPCGIPISILLKSDRIEFMFTNWDLFSKWDLNHCRVLPIIP